MRPLAAQPFDPSLCFVVSMRMDVVDLRNFYAHPLGTVARRFVGRGVRRLWAGSAGLRMLGVGYATPYLGLFREEAERCLAFMPAAQGVVKWPSARPTLVALVDECELPLPDAAIDRRWFLRSALAWERTGATMSAPFAGVHLVEATKQVYRAIPVRAKKLVPTLKPVLDPVLAPSPGGAARISSLHAGEAEGARSWPGWSAA